MRLDGPLEEIRRELRSYAWDSDDEAVELKSSDVADILSRFLTGTVTAGEVETWANEVEGRDDIGFGMDQEDILKDVIFFLANPAINEPLSSAAAERMLGRLRGR